MRRRRRREWVGSGCVVGDFKRERGKETLATVIMGSTSASGQAGSRRGFAAVNSILSHTSLVLFSSSLWGDTYVTSARGGGSGYADEVREVAWISRNPKKKSC